MQTLGAGIFTAEGSATLIHAGALEQVRNVALVGEDELLDDFRLSGSSVVVFALQSTSFKTNFVHVA